MHQLPNILGQLYRVGDSVCKQLIRSLHDLFKLLLESEYPRVLDEEVDPY